MRLTREVKTIVLFLSLYVVWASASLFWSDSVSLSFRRIGELILLMVGTVGLGFGFYGRRKEGLNEFVRHAIYAGVICGIFAAVDGFSELSFRGLFEPSFRVQASSPDFIWAVSFSLVALFATRQVDAVKKAVLAVPLFVSVLIMKGRASTALALVVLCVVIDLAKRRKTGLILLGVGSCAVACFVSTLDVYFDELGTFLRHVFPTFGGENEAVLNTLDGRIPLWTELFSYLANHPFIGYGFGAFWNSDRMAAVWKVIRWEAPVGHNGFIDEALGTGLIGLTLLLIAVVLTVKQCIQITLRNRSTSAAIICGFLLLLILLNVTDSLFQSFFRYPFICSVVGASALLARSLVPPKMTQGDRVGDWVKNPGRV